MLAPVVWEPPQVAGMTSRGSGGSSSTTVQQCGTLRRPLRLLGEQVVHAAVRQHGQRLIVEFSGRAAALRRANDCPEERAHMCRQLRRMLRLEHEDDMVVAKFHSMHRRAKREGFGRLFRNPSLWEDIVKTVLLCNCGWNRTLTMARKLCKLVGTEGDCPSAKELAAAPLAVLRKAGLGYRAARLQRLAACVVASGVQPRLLCDAKESLVALQAISASAEGASSAMKEASAHGLRGPPLFMYVAARVLPGFGEFAARNLLQLCGVYSMVAVDSETSRHLQARRGLPPSELVNPAAVRDAADRVYRRYGRHKQLAYWWELWRGYEAVHGSVVSMNSADYVKCCRTPMST